MQLDHSSPQIFSRLYEGTFGLEKESLRVESKSGKCAATLHPFDNPQIVQDFAENQTEINTEVYPTWKEARARCEQLTIDMLAALAQQNEVLWPFSNPPRIDNPDDIPVMTSGGEQAKAYRLYLSSRYGRMKMVYSGIHYNFAFSEDLLQAQFSLQSEYEDYQLFKNAFYLDLVQKLVKNGWLIDILLNASPVYDGSLMTCEDAGKSAFGGMSSMRNSDLGYWNFFTPNFDYSSMESYTDSIRKYVRTGLLRAPRELYYPIRLKPAGEYSLHALEENGASHIELRMIDLNPYEFSGISEDDAWFCHLLLIYLACQPGESLSWKDQIYAEQNFKNASFYQLDQSRILLDDDTSLSADFAAVSLLDAMAEFFRSIGDQPAIRLIARERLKITASEACRHASRVRQDFPDFTADGLKQALHLQQEALQRLIRNCSDK